VKAFRECNSGPAFSLFKTSAKRPAQQTGDSLVTFFSLTGKKKVTSTEVVKFIGRNLKCARSSAESVTSNLLHRIQDIHNQSIRILINFELFWTPFSKQYFRLLFPNRERKILPLQK